MRVCIIVSWGAPGTRLSLFKTNVTSFLPQVHSRWMQVQGIAGNSQSPPPPPAAPSSNQHPGPAAPRPADQSAGSASSGSVAPSVRVGMSFAHNTIGACMRTLESLQEDGFGIQRIQLCRRGGRGGGGFSIHTLVCVSVC
jgi:hypothetical protein